MRHLCRSTLTVTVFGLCAVVATSHLQAGQRTYTASISSAAVITAGVVGTPSQGTGTATFVLTQVDGDPSATTLSYDIQLFGLDLDGAQTPDPNDNVTAVHLHNVSMCAPMVPTCLPGDTAGTMHVLNIYGAPRRDDADLVEDAAAGTLRGVWDISDTNLIAPPTVSIADPMTLDVLFRGDMYLMLHTFEVPSGAVGGQLVEVPEPASWMALLGCLTILPVVRGRRG